MGMDGTWRGNHCAGVWYDNGSQHTIGIEFGIWEILERTIVLVYLGGLNLNSSSARMCVPSSSLESPRCHCHAASIFKAFIGADIFSHLTYMILQYSRLGIVFWAMFKRLDN